MDKFHFDRIRFISSSLKGYEISLVLDNLGKDQYHMIWCSSERFQNKQFRKTFADFENYTLLFTAVIDEVHCLSKWRHDLRVSYLTLS